MKSRARDEEATSWQVWSRGGSIGNKGPSLVSEYSTREEAAAKAKRMNKLLSPGEKAYYGLGYGIKEKKPAKDNDVLPIPVAKARGVVSDTVEQYSVSGETTKNGRVNSYFNSKIEAEKEAETLKRLGYKNVKLVPANDVLPVPVTRGAARDGKLPNGLETWSTIEEAEKRAQAYVQKPGAPGKVYIRKMSNGEFTYWLDRTGDTVKKVEKRPDGRTKDVLPVPVTRGAARDAKPPAKGMFVEFYKKPGQFFKLSSNSDAAMDAAVKQAGLWKKGADYPDFTVYKDGEETTGGGGPNSGVMDSIQSEGDDVSPIPLGYDEAFPKGPSSPREKAGLSVQEWNALPAARRKELIAAKDVYDPQTSIWRFEAELRELMRKGRPSQDRPAQVMWDRDKEELEAALVKARKDLAKSQAKDDSNWHGYAWAVIEVASALHVSEQKAQRMLMLQAKKTKGTWQETVDDVIAAALNKTRPKRVKDAYDYEASGDLKQDVEDALKTLADRDLGAVAISLKYDFALDFVKDVLRGKFGAGRGAITAYFKAHPLGGPGQANDAAKDAEQAKSFSGSTSREARQKAKSYADSLRAQGYEIIWVVPTGVYSYEVAYKKVYA